MVNPIILEAYKKYAPRWFKVIRWRGWAQRTVELQNMAMFCCYVPIVYATWFAFNPYPLLLCIKKPQTEEERMKLKRDTIVMSAQRDWEIGQYNHGRPPIMDVWRRRQNYPEHYGNKYDRFERDGFVSPI